MSHFSWTEPLRAVRTVIVSDKLRRSLAAYLLFNTAEWAVWVGMLVYAYDKGGVSAASAVAVAQLLPAALLAPLAAAWGDRLPRSLALAGSYVIQAAVMLLSFMLLRSQAPALAVYASAVLVSVAISASRPIFLASLPGYTQTPGELTAANSVSTMIESVAVILGPAIAGMTMDAGGAATLFALFAAGQLCAAALVGRQNWRAPGTAPAETWGWRDSLQGLGELRQRRGSLLILGYVAVNYLLVGTADVLAVVLSFEVLSLGSSGPGLLISAMGVGGVVGAAMSVLLAGRRRLSVPTALALGFAGVPYALTGMSTQLVLSVALLAVAGAGKSFLDVAARTMLQRVVDDTVLARVFGVQESLMLLALATGSLIVPLLVGIAGPRGAFLLAGLLLPFIGIISWQRLAAVDASADPPSAALALLRRIPMFAHLPAPVIERVARRAGATFVAKGEIVVRQGDAGNLFYVVESGRLEVTVDGRPRPDLGPGSYFGEIALIRRTPRTATVTAAAPSRLWSLDSETFVAAITGSRSSSDAAEAVVVSRLAAKESASRRD